MINSTKAPTNAAEHEYQHFLFAQVVDKFDILPEVSERRIQEEERGAEALYEEKRERLARGRTETELALEQEFEELGHVTPETAKKLMAAERQLDALPSLLQKSTVSRAIQHSTYPAGAIRKAYNQFRDEFAAYASTGLLLQTQRYFGKTLKDANQDPYLPTFEAETKLFSGVLAYAKKRGTPPEKLGLLVGSSRNMQQAAKFTFLETQIRSA